MGRDLPGRWFARTQPRPEPTAVALARAEAHLERLGLVTRGAVVASGDPGGFAAAYRTLSAMEERGRVHRIYAVEGLGASQFALPGVVDELRAMQRELGAAPPTTLVLAATDPANAYGAALEWPQSQWAGDGGGPHRPSRGAGAHVVLRDGLPILYLERGGHSLLTFPVPDAGVERGEPSTGAGDEATAQEVALADAAAALVDAVRRGRVPELTITRINGMSALQAESEHMGVVRALAEAGFTTTPRGFRARRAAPRPSARPPAS